MMGRFDQNDTSERRVVPSFEELTLPEPVLARVTHDHSAATCSFVPKFRYWACDDGRRMSRPENYCGHQQRAFEFYWCLWAFERGQLALSVGAGAVGAPNCLTTDKYCGTPPEGGESRYGTTYGYSAMTMSADEKWPFHNAQFGVVVFNHSFEHLHAQEHAIREALRVTKSDGRICVLQPDMTFARRGKMDPTHTREWCGVEFLAFLENEKDDNGGFDVHSHNVLDNDFSFETVLRRH